MNDLPLTISQWARSVLRRGGFEASAREVLALSPSELAAELAVDPREALKLQAELRANLAPRPLETTTTTTNVMTGDENVRGERLANGAVSALEMLRTNESKGERHIVTTCRDLDRMLGGGVMRGTVTELFGPPGCGKTQLCMQLCVSAAIPVEYGGVEGGSIYFDTEGSMSSERLYDMASALSSHLSEQRKRAASQDALPPAPTPEEILRRVRYCNCFDRAEQLAFSLHLPRLLKANPDVRLVVIDSAAFHFRQDFSNLGERNRALTRHVQQLNACAAEFDVAVVVTNHVTTRVGTSSTTGGGGGETASFLVPALGESWSHAVTNRVELVASERFVRWAPKRDPTAGCETRLRRATLVKSPYLARGAAEFVVVRQGIRPAPPPTTTNKPPTPPSS